MCYQPTSTILVWPQVNHLFFELNAIAIFYAQLVRRTICFRRLTVVVDQRLPTEAIASFLLSPVFKNSFQGGEHSAAAPSFIGAAPRIHVWMVFICSRRNFRRTIDEAAIETTRSGDGCLNYILVNRAWASNRSQNIPSCTKDIHSRMVSDVILEQYNVTPPASTSNLNFWPRLWGLKSWTDFSP
ncbi:hypothetical protein B0H19DRAFT_1063143 [Mycena capillaripes]|nr:hypothetical protein B0H19DRAFT_1063143 [Mycena capillaripes]